MPKVTKPKTTKKASEKTAAPRATKAAASGKSAKTAKTTKAAKPTKTAKTTKSKDESKVPASLSSKRKLGLRGAAPWAARHAAKHAAEARARAAEPAPPGSARATLRVPSGAEEIKAKIAELHNQTQKIRTLRKRLEKGFFEIGEVLTEIQQQELYLAKGYGSFEAFLEREIDLGKLTSLKLMKIAHTFQKEAAIDLGMDRLFNALAAIEGDVQNIPKAAPSTPGSRPPLPLKPPMRSVG